MKLRLMLYSFSKLFKLSKGLILEVLSSAGQIFLASSTVTKRSDLGWPEATVTLTSIVSAGNKIIKARFKKDMTSAFYTVAQTSLTKDA